MQNAQQTPDVEERLKATDSHASVGESGKDWYKAIQTYMKVKSRV